VKRVLLVVAVGMALNSPLLQAASPDAATVTGSSKSPTKSPAEFDKNLAQLQQQMNQMQAQMEQIRKTQDPQERQKLLKQHWDTMQSAMSEMRGMWGPGMMGPGMMGGGMMGGGTQGNAGPGWGHMGGYYSHLTPEQLRQRQYMTDQYMKMQQEMMSNMMLHQQYWMGSPPAGTQ
jgi:hypothetical protein